MSRTTWAKARLPLRLLGAAVGILLFVHLIHRAGPAKLFASMVALGWGLALVMAWGGVAHVVKTWAWRLTLLDEKCHVSFVRMLGLRLASEAVGQLGGVAQLFGEGLRVSLLGPAMPLSSGIASVTIDRAFFVISAAVVSVVGLMAVLTILPLPHTLALYAAAFASILLGVVLLSAIAIRKRWRVLSRTAQVIAHIPYLRDWIERERPLVHSVENNLLDFYHRTPRAFWGSFTLNLASHVSAIVEVYLILWLMGARVGLFAALAVEALTKLVNVAGTFNPGNVGTYEGGNMLIVKMFGLTATAGLTLAFTRRLRALFWAAVGGLCIVPMARLKKQEANKKDILVSGPEPTSLGELPTMNESAAESHTAVILANNLGDYGFRSPMPTVGAVPILLRTILGVHKAGAQRIVVIIDRSRVQRLQQDLFLTGRLPQIIEWRVFKSAELSLPSLLGEIATGAKGDLIFIAADRVYHPSLLKRAMEWDRKDETWVPTTESESVGICCVTREAAIELATRCPASADSIEELEDWLNSTDSVYGEPVPRDQWQRIRTEQQRLVAERKLDGWLVKPTDGIFARTNRRISIPISRLIIPYPISPNMVSLFTLGVSFAAGAFLALGGYWNMLTGAILSWLSSVLDGCDGEVARLKLQESPFGCWLETICDNLYYLFIFFGMTIGLVRSSGNRSYLLWGGLLLLGATASALTTGLQRHQMSSDRPEQYLQHWHKQAESRSSNPLLYLGRHTEFIIRRCFLPYLIFIFAVFGVMNWFLVGATVGANIVWMVALYSYLTFNPSRTRAFQSSTSLG